MEQPSDGVDPMPGSSGSDAVKFSQSPARPRTSSDESDKGIPAFYVGDLAEYLDDRFTETRDAYESINPLRSEHTFLTQDFLLSVMCSTTGKG
ncbi:hypothetical protein BaRGS_00036266 [Batillaria attramentaria]|uniref:Uncharacterized protein n=1 Tax=Batillaria attramentaria TaxID=370345 RepID=A0ABD0JC99_9CAEN